MKTIIASILSSENILTGAKSKSGAGAKSKRVNFLYSNSRPGIDFADFCNSLYTKSGKNVIDSKTKNSGSTLIDTFAKNIPQDIKVE